MRWPPLYSILVLVLLPIMAATLLYPQGADREPVIRVSSDLVLVPVSVTDEAGRPVPDLTESDFRILEDGRPQTVVRMDEPGQSPVELALLIDVSGSVKGRFEFEQAAGSAFLNKIVGAERRVTVFAVGSQVRQVQPRTDRAEDAVAGLNAISPTQETTAFFDAVAEAARQLRLTAPSDARRAVMVISDGEDNDSVGHDFQSALRELQLSDALFYAINPAGSAVRLNRVSRAAQRTMEELAAATGGAAYLPENLENLPDIFDRIAAELETQYLLAYYSSDRGGNQDFRRIDVTVPTRPGVKVKARQGYYVSHAAQAQRKPGVWVNQAGFSNAGGFR
jgi:Ca-activated chloride channel homolog